MLSKLRRWLREGAILLVLLAGVIILLDVWRSPQMPAMFDSTPLHTLDGETVTLASISEERPVLLYFWASWCGPCKMVHSEVRQAAARFGDAVSVVQVNVDNHRALAEKYEIMAVPTLLFFKDGKPLKRIIGYASRSEISDFLATLVPKRRTCRF